MAPATAWLPMPMTWATNAGATAVNKPITAKPANAAVDAMMKIERSLRGHRKPLEADLSGAR